MTDNLFETTVTRLHLLRGVDLIFCRHFLLLLDRGRRTHVACHDARSRRFCVVHAPSIARERLVSALPPLANYLIAFAYCAFSFYCAYYMNTEYMALGIERAGAWNATDLIMGGVMTILIMEYARKRHMPLFILDIALIVYAVYGNWVPGMFYHAGLTWERFVTANSVEVATGIFSRLPQIALTAVGSFLLVLSLLARLRLHRVAAARDQAGRFPLPACHSAVGSGWLDVCRHGQWQRCRQCHYDRLRDDSGDDRFQHPPRDRGGN